MIFILENAEKRNVSIKKKNSVYVYMLGGWCFLLLCLLSYFLMINFHAWNYWIRGYAYIYCI